LNENPVEIAKEHWAWHRRFLTEVCGLSDSELTKLGRVAIDYFLHGYKHAERLKKEVKRWPRNE